MARIVIGAYVVRFPVGGYFSWVLQWLLGFRRLGHDVFLVEKSGYENSCFDPRTRLMSNDCSYGVERVRTLLAEFGLENTWCYADSKNRYHGLSRRSVEEIFNSSDLFVDMGSHGTWLQEAATSRMRVLVDGEPGFRQMKMTSSLESGATQPEYDFYYTVGRNIGTCGNVIPNAERNWHPIFDPVIVDLFPILPVPSEAPFTTVMSWQAHAPIRFQGKTYGQKDVEFAKFLDLPSRTTAAMEIAVSGNIPTESLLKTGWRIRDSVAATLSFDAWRRYISNSKGEFSVAKNVFVATNSGFFSDRSAVYLAGGRPVVMQDTGFSAHLPCGEGLFAVRTVEEAAAAIDEIQGDYERHSKAAREIAIEYLEARKVLGGFLSELGL